MTKHKKIKQRGFSLIEMMIGVAIGLLGLLAVTQVLLTFNTNRRATTQTMEAQSNGTMALYLLERNIAQAGYGLMNIQDCSTINWYYSNAVQTPLTTMPVSITDGGAASDSIVVQYASSTDGVPETKIPLAQAAYTGNLPVASIVGFTAGNLAVADVGGVCTLYQVTSTPNSATMSLAHATNAYNPAAAPGGAGWNLLAVGSTNVVANLGNFVGRSFVINSNNLTSGTFPTMTTATTLVDGIVFMKAEYGLDNNGDRAVDTWTNATGLGLTNQAIASQAVAIRIGIVARTAEPVTANAPAITLLPKITDAVGATIGNPYTYTPPNKNYRYKSYYTIIPMRNTIW